MQLDTNSLSAQKYLQGYFEDMKVRNPKMSLRSWARIMGLREHSLLVLLLKGKREIRVRHLEFLLRGMNLDENERRRFKTLVLAQNTQNEEERLLLLSDACADDAFEMELDQFRLVSHWIHFALLEMTELKGFRPEPEWVAEHLDAPIAPSEIREAWERLKRLGLVREVKQKWKKTNRSLTTSGKSANQAVRLHHQQIIDLARRAVETQTLSDRLLNSCTMTIDRSKLPIAQQLILDFRKKMEALVETSGGDATYQLSVQFFRLSRDLSKNQEVNQKERK